MVLRPLLASLIFATTACPVSPVSPVHVVVPFRAPTSAYASGHRGIDLAALPGQVVVSPISGVVVFAGIVVDRPVLSISDGRRRYSLEPVEAGLSAGTPVLAGTPVGSVGVGGHCSLHCVHVGLRVGDRYVNPLTLHARLVPIG